MRSGAARHVQAAEPVVWEEVDIDTARERGATMLFGEQYGEVFVAVNFESGIEQLINFLAAITAQKELIGTSEIHIGQANPKQKTMPVRILLSGLVRKELIPDKKGTSF